MATKLVRKRLADVEIVETPGAEQYVLLRAEDGTTQRILATNLGGEGGGGGGDPYTPMRIKAQGTATTDISDSNALLVWDSPVISHSDGSISGSVFTANADRVYTFAVTAGISGASNRVELTISAEIFDGSDWIADSDETISDYVARDGSGQSKGGVTLVTMFDLSDGDTVRFRAATSVDGGSSANLTPSTTRLIVT